MGDIEQDVSDNTTVFLYLASSENGGPTSHAQLAEMMSHLLQRHGDGPVLNNGPELLTVLQNVCGQVTQLRLDDAAAAEKEKIMKNGTW